jgi:hypothetical protein
MVFNGSVRLRLCVGDSSCDSRLWVHAIYQFSGFVLRNIYLDNFETLRPCGYLP